MLVRNTDAQHLHTLNALREHIDYWVIADLGCEPQVLETIRSALTGVDGEFVDIEPDTAANCKNALMEYSKQFADYLLLSEPHLLFSIEDSSYRDKLAQESYFLEANMPIQYSQLRLIKTDQAWAYFGVACETLLSADKTSNTRLEQIKFRDLRGREQFLEDTRLAKEKLATQLESEPDDPHSLFHLAKLTMQSADWPRALELFDKYLAAEQFWDEQWQWYALYHRAKLLEKLEHNLDQIIDSYLKAAENRPQRAEPLYELSRLYRTKGRFLMANLYSKAAFDLNLPPNETYDLERAVYEWHIPSEHLLSSQKLNQLDSAIVAANRALRADSSAVSKNMRDSLIISRQRCVNALQANNSNAAREQSKNRIRLIIPFRNAGEFLKKSIDSILTQDYDNFSATFIDDCSDDGSADLVPSDDSRFTLIQNSRRVGPLVNRMNFILSCDPEDIVVYLDGDDQLASTDCLSYINQIYNRTDCWLSYGQYISQNGTVGYAQPYATQQQLINELESGEMRFPMHPITHRAGLFQQLKNFDPEYTCFKDDAGDWLFYASDAVLARPLFYMAGVQNIHYCNRVLYLYTEGHAISESIDNKADQLETCRIINTRVKPPLLASYQI